MHKQLKVTFATNDVEAALIKYARENFDEFFKAKFKSITTEGVSGLVTLTCTLEGDY